MLRFSGLEAEFFSGDKQVKPLGRVTHIRAANILDATQAILQGVAMDVQYFGDLSESAPKLEISFQGCNQVATMMRVMLAEFGDLFHIGI